MSRKNRHIHWSGSCYVVKDLVYNVYGRFGWHTIQTFKTWKEAERFAKVRERVLGVYHTVIQEKKR